MWITPRAHSSPGMFWIKCRENEFFEMLEAKGGSNSGTLLGNVVSVVLSSSEKNALKYRIIIKSAIPHVIAVSNSYDQMLKHWLFTEELLTKANTMEDSEFPEKTDFMIAKIASMADAAEEEEDDQNDEYYVAKYHRDFELEDQKLLTYFRCSLWDKVPTKGVLFISKDYACYTAATPHRVKAVIPIKEIRNIQKESTFGLIPNSVKITCKEGKHEKQYFITFILREEAYSTLSQLWRRVMEQLENPVPPSPSIIPPSPNIIPPSPYLPPPDTTPSAPPLSPDEFASAFSNTTLSSPTSSPLFPSVDVTPHSPNPPAHDPSSVIPDPSNTPPPIHDIPPSPSFSAGPNIVPSSPSLNTDPSKYGLDRERRNEDYQALFKLPASESLMEEYWCSIWRKSYVVGKLYVSRNFCCFHANVSKELTIVMSFYQIGSIQKEKSMKVISNAIKVITKNNREFFFVLYNRDTAFATMNNLWKAHVQSNRKVVCPPMVDLSQFGWSVSTETEPKESEELINYKKQQWNKFFKKNGFALDMVKTKRLRELVRNGINSDLRGPVWLLCSGAMHWWEIEPTLFSSLLERHKNEVSTATEEIEKDLHRTLAHHAYFQTPEAIQQLRNVLTAYSWRNPSIGYCQAMNVVCAAMLMHTTEEASFWLLSIICEDLLKGYYNTAMLGSIVDQKIYEDLAQSYFPALHAHLINVGLPIQILSLPWFMCLFIGYIPWEVATRVIDCIFYEGSLVLFQVGLAVLKLNYDAILAEEDSEKIVEMLKKRQYDSEQLMTVTFRDFAFGPDKLTELRNAQKYKTLRHL